MPGKAVQIGPFLGGLNTFSDPSNIADNELVECVNFEVGLDGALKSRPPIVASAGDDGWTQRIYLIGTAVFDDTYLFGSNENGTWYFSSGAWTLITDDAEAAAMLQYNDAVYFVPKPGHATIALFKWNPTNGYSDLSPTNLKTMMGSADYGGTRLINYNERMFIIPGAGKTANTSRVIFSDAGDPETYTATTQFFDVSPGDGQILMDGIAVDDNILLFKEDSSYVFTFTSTPSDAELVNINRTIGASTTRGVVQYENSVFVYHRNNVYEIANYNFTCVNIRVPFAEDTTVPTDATRIDTEFMTRLGDRLILRRDNKLYVYGMRTKTWSEWKSADDELHNFGPLVHYLSDSEDSYYAGSCLDGTTDVFNMIDGWDSATKENNGTDDIDITCTITTKNYDLKTSHQFKKLNWWGADVLTLNDVTGTVSPVVLEFSVTWGDIHNQEKTWDDLLTWGRPLADAKNSSATVSSNISIMRRFLKFPKALRFRQANFKLDFTTDGTVNDGPAQLFSITLVGSVKQVVTGDVN